MAVTYHEATEKDLPFIVEVYNQTIPERNATADLTPVSVVDRKAWFASHDPKTRPLWLIVVDQTLAGWISLSDFYGRPAYQNTVEISIYIDQAFRKQGLGQKVLEFVESQVTELHITTILAFVFGHNQASQKLFKQNGYVTWGHLPQIALMDNNHYDLDILGKHFN